MLLAIDGLKHSQDTGNSTNIQGCFKLVKLLHVLHNHELNVFSQGLCVRQVDMLQDGISKSSTALSRMAKKLKSMTKHRKQKGQRIGGADVLVHMD